MLTRPVPTRSIFNCQCGESFPSHSVTRARCPKCHAFVKSHIPMPILIKDPRQTLSACQEALEAIAARARDGTGNEQDVMYAKIFTDSMKYLVPVLEASFVQTTDDTAILEKLLGKDDDAKPENNALLPHPKKAMLDIDAILVDGKETT